MKVTLSSPSNTSRSQLFQTPTPPPMRPTGRNLNGNAKRDRAYILGHAFVYTPFYVASWSEAKDFIGQIKLAATVIRLKGTVPWGRDVNARRTTFRQHESHIDYHVFAASFLARCV